MLRHVKDRVRERYGAQVAGLWVLGVLVAIIWAVEIVNALDSYRLGSDGIVPRDPSHLDGIVFARVAALSRARVRLSHERPD